jgi:tetratricopeptide (TPR) repeat protein
MTATHPHTDARAAASMRLASLRRFLAAEPDNQRLRRDVVDTAVAAGDFQYLRELAESRLADTPADPEAQFDRATALIGLRDFEAALGSLQSLDGSIPGVRFNTGLCLFMLGRFAEAKPFLQAGYDAGERSPGQLRLLLRTLHHVAEIDAAVVIADANATLIASDPDLAGTAALLYIDANDARKATRYAHLALAGNPSNVDALLSSGTLSSLELDVAGARAAYDRVVELHPANGRAWLGLGLLSMGERDFKSAIGQFERGLQTMGEHIGSWHSLAWAHLFSGDIDRAESVFKHALEMDPNFSESHGSLAVIAAMRGKREEAERYIKVAERLDRNGMAAKFATTLLAGSADESRKMLADLIETVPGHGPRFAAMLRQSRRP